MCVCESTTASLLSSSSVEEEIDGDNISCDAVYFWMICSESSEYGLKLFVIDSCFPSFISVVFFSNLEQLQIDYIKKTTWCVTNCSFRFIIILPLFLDDLNSI